MVAPGLSPRLPTQTELADWGAFANYLESQPEAMRNNVVFDDVASATRYTLQDVLDHPELFDADKPAAYFSTQNFERAFVDAGMPLRATQKSAQKFGAASAYTDSLTSEAAIRLSTDSLVELLGENPTQDAVQKLAAGLVSANDPHGTVLRLFAYAKDYRDVADELFLALAFEKPAYAAELILEGLANPDKSDECGHYLKVLYNADPKWFQFLCEEADILDPNAGYTFQQVAGQSLNVDKNAPYSSGIMRLNTINGSDKALAEELAGSDQIMSPKEVLAYLQNQSTAYAFVFSQTVEDRLQEVALVLARELASGAGYDDDKQTLRAGVFFNDLNALQSSFAASLFAKITKADFETGVRVMKSWCAATTDQALLESSARHIRESLGDETYYRLYDKLSKQAQGLIEPQRNVSVGVDAGIQAEQVAINRAGFAQVTSKDLGLSTLDVARKQEELDAFFKFIPPEIREDLSGDETRLREIYDNWAKGILPSTQEIALAQGEEVGAILTKLQIESVFVQKENNCQAAGSVIETLHPRAREEMRGLVAEMSDSYDLLLKARAAYQSGDIKKARGILDYASSNLMLLQQSMEVVEALNVARDSGLMGLGYQNYSGPCRDTLDRLTKAETSLIEARRMLGFGQQDGVSDGYEDALKKSLTASQRAFNNSVGQIKTDITGTNHDAGWSMMMTDQVITEGLILGGKFAVGTAAMVGLFCLAGPIGGYVGATVGGALFGVGTTAATVSGVLIGLGVESLIFMGGEKVIGATGTLASSLLEGETWDAATDKATEELVYHSLSEFGWDYAGTVVSLGVLKGFTHGAAALVQKGLISDGALAYGTSFLAEMTGMGMGQTSVESMEYGVEKGKEYWNEHLSEYYTFEPGPVYIIQDGVKTEVTDLSMIWNGDRLKDNIIGSFQTVLTYRIAGRMMKSGTEPISKFIHDKQVNAEIKMFESQEVAFAQKLKGARTLQQFEAMSQQRIAAGRKLYSQSLQTLSDKEQLATTPEAKAALGKELAAVEKKYLEYEAMATAFVQRSAIAADMKGQVAAYSEKRARETRDTSKPTHLEIKPTRIIDAARADPNFEATAAVSGKAVQAVAEAGPTTTREQLREAALAEATARGKPISSDTAKAIDSMIDVALSLKQHGVIGDGPGQLTATQLAEILSILYINGNPNVRIDATELTHVPQVVEGVLNFLESASGGKATASEKKVAALTALIHDSVKATLDLRTESGYTITQHPFFNNTGRDIHVKPGQSFKEAIAELQASDPTFDASKLTTPELLIGVIVHHDGSNVKAFAQELARMGIITDAEATMMWEAVQKHGLVSSWILDNSLAGIGIRSEVFTDPKNARFIELYRKFAKTLNDKTAVEAIEADPAQAAELAELRAEFDKLFTPLEKAMLLGDHQGQIDPSKYLAILGNVGVNKNNADLTAHEIIFGGGKGANPMTDSVMGVILKHMREQQLLSPELAANSSVAFKKAIAWLMMPEGRGGLADAILSDPTARVLYDAWTPTEGASKSVGEWLKTIKVNDPTSAYSTVKAALEKGFYKFYAPATAEARPGFAFENPEVRAARPSQATLASNMTQRSAAFNEHGYNPEAVDALYEQMAATGNEHTASPGPNGTFQIKEGKEHEALTDLAEVELEMTDLDGTNTRTVLAKAMAEAHIHNGAPMPSVADLTYLSGLAHLQPGRPATHTIFGLVGGEHAFVKVTATYDGTRVNYEVTTSENMANVDMSLLARKTGIIDGALDRMTPDQIEAEMKKVADGIEVRTSTDARQARDILAGIVVTNQALNAERTQALAELDDAIADPELLPAINAQSLQNLADRLQFSKIDDFIAAHGAPNKLGAFISSLRGQQPSSENLLRIAALTDQICDNIRILDTFLKTHDTTTAIGTFISNAKLSAKNSEQLVLVTNLTKRLSETAPQFWPDIVTICGDTTPNFVAMKSGLEVSNANNFPTKLANKLPLMRSLEFQINNFGIFKLIQDAHNALTTPEQKKWFEVGIKRTLDAKPDYFSSGWNELKTNLMLTIGEATQLAKTNPVYDKFLRNYLVKEYNKYGGTNTVFDGESHLIECLSIFQDLKKGAATEPNVEFKVKNTKITDKDNVDPELRTDKRMIEVKTARNVPKKWFLKGEDSFFHQLPKYFKSRGSRTINYNLVFGGGKFPTNFTDQFQSLLKTLKDSNDNLTRADLEAVHIDAFEIRDFSSATAPTETSNLYELMKTNNVTELPL